MNAGRIIFFFGIGLLGGACSDDQARGVDTGQSRSAIENGATGNDAAALGIPVVRTQHFDGIFASSGDKKFCTGWMYNNEWMITARHCFIDKDTGKIIERKETTGITMGSQTRDGFGSASIKRRAIATIPTTQLTPSRTPSRSARTVT